MTTKVAVMIVLLCAIVLGTSAFSLQGCDMPKCAPKKVDCKMQCNENGKESDGCMRCWNEFKLNCSECIPKEPRGYNVGSNFNNKVPTAHIEGCDALDLVSCSAVLVGCAAVCAAAEIDLPACIACCGGSYSTCKDCF